MLTSDSKAGAHPIIARAFYDASISGGYNNHNMNEKLNTVVSHVFDRESFVIPVTSVSFGNNLAVKVLAQGKPGEVLCSKTCHMLRHERGDTAQFAGVRLNPVSRVEYYSHGEQDTLDAHSITAHFEGKADYVSSTLGPQSLGIVITQADEEGLIYADDKFITLSQTARDRSMFIHVDGVRFANAVAAGSDPKIWGKYADTICLGARKNGASSAEALIFFDRAAAEQAQHHISIPKYPYIAELMAYFENDLWLNNALHANNMADRLRRALQGPNSGPLPDKRANIVFQNIPDPRTLENLKNAGCEPYQWPMPWRTSISRDRYRLVTAWNTKSGDIERVSNIINQAHSSKNCTNKLKETNPATDAFEIHKE